MKTMMMFFLSILASVSVAQANELELTLNEPNQILINATTRSCAQQITDPGQTQPDDIPSLFLPFGGFRLNWTGKNPLTIAYIEVTVQAPDLAGGQQVIDIASSELAYIWSGSLSLVDIPAGVGPVSSSSDCYLTVGGIKLNGLDKSTFGHGTVTVYGTTAAGNGTVGVAAKADFDFAYHAPIGN